MLALWLALSLARKFALRLGLGFFLNGPSIGSTPTSGRTELTRATTPTPHTAVNFGCRACCKASCRIAKESKRGAVVFAGVEVDIRSCMLLLAFRSNMWTSCVSIHTHTVSPAHPLLRAKRVPRRRTQVVHFDHNTLSP